MNTASSLSLSPADAVEDEYPNHPNHERLLTAGVALPNRESEKARAKLIHFLLLEFFLSFAMFSCISFSRALSFLITTHRQLSSHIQTRT